MSRLTAPTRRAARRAPSRVSVRPYRRSDDAGLSAVCLATADEGRDGSALYARPSLPGEVYALPYVRFEPDLCLVVDDGTREGGVSGYVLGTSDTAAFEDWATRAWWPGVRSRHPVADQEPGSADARLAALAASPQPTARAVVEAYPAHLHVDLMPHVQGQGLGRRLLEGFMQHAHGAGAAGVHLGVSTGNERAVGFYERLGFEVLERTERALLMGRLLP
ncbi:GNAT family N-acetyltransferase [Aquipuribacter hungaricus]|uniref:GNAT family N-acetyltransferase n=1 Tax=Aquipuribacter hungaricus TaxID=545624 RepID=A0ABV7WKH2_9MICO